MYQVSDTVLYGTDGVCKIVEIVTKHFTQDATGLYYVLKPVYHESATIFIPVGNQTLTDKMRPVLTRDEVLQIIHSMPELDALWIADDAKRQKTYEKILRSGDRMQIIRMIKALYSHEKYQQEHGRKFHTADQKIMKEAESMLYEEFAYVLDIQQEKVLPFIIDHIHQKQPAERESALLH